MIEGGSWTTYRCDMARRATIQDILLQIRARYVRLEPEGALAAMTSGALLVDIRDGEQRRRDGTIPGALIIDRTVLEWRIDPDSGATHPAIPDLSTPLILICNQGYSSILAVGSLLDLGAASVTDVSGGFEAWRAAGLPIQPTEKGPMPAGRRAARATANLPGPDRTSPRAG